MFGIGLVLSQLGFGMAVAAIFIPGDQVLTLSIPGILVQLIGIGLVMASD